MKMKFGIKPTIVFKKIDSQAIHNKIFLKTKIKSYCDETADFSNKKCLKLALTKLI